MENSGPILQEDGTALIPLANGQFAIIDAQDVEKVQSKKWLVATRGDVVCYVWSQGNRQVVKLHRLILDAPTGMSVDHKNHNRLDNRRCNIRVCTQSQNGANMRAWSKPKASSYKGVTFHAGKWEAFVKKNRVRTYLGRFTSEIEAALAYNAAAIQLHGEFAHINHIQ